MASPDTSAMSEASESEPGPDSSGFRSWPGLVGRWLFRRRAERQDLRGPAEPVPRFRNICISRESGAGGGTIARMVGRRLHWKVYDHELLEAIAHRMEVSSDEVRAFDELAPSVVQDWILPLREEHYAPQEAYLDHLAKLVEAIGRAGESIIVGRGANFLLPRAETLTVRIVAPLKARAVRLAERMHVSIRTAPRPRATSTDDGLTSIASCIGPIPTTRTTSISCSTRTAWDSPSAPS